MVHMLFGHIAGLAVGAEHLRLLHGAGGAQAAASGGEEGVVLPAWLQTQVFLLDTIPVSMTSSTRMQHNLFSAYT